MTIAEIKLGTKESMSMAEDDLAKPAWANTGVLTSDLKKTFATVDGDWAADELTTTDGLEHYTIRALTGNLYVAAPTKDIVLPLAEWTGFSPEKNEWPLDWTNMEPAQATLCEETNTCARECGLGEMSVRGMGIRVVAAVRAPNGPIGECASAYSSGGDSETEHDCDVDIARTMGFVEIAPEGETRRP